MPHLNDQEKIALSHKVWKNIGIIFSLTIKVDSKELISNTKITGLEHLKKVHANGRGLILISAHIGTWDAMCAKIGNSIAKCDGVVRHVNNPFLNKRIQRIRLKVFNVITKNSSAALKMLRSVNKENIICMLSDQKMWGTYQSPILW